MNSKSSNNNNKKGELTATFSCKLCPKNISDNDHAILRVLCQTWVHSKCNHLSYIDYTYLQSCDKPWYCLSYTNTLFAFGNLNNQNCLTFTGDNTTIRNETENLNSSLLLKPHPNLALLFKQFNNAIPENRSDPENVIQGIYYDLDELQQSKIPNKEKFLYLCFYLTLSLFRINSCLLNKNSEELQSLLQSKNITFDVTAITETRNLKIFFIK